MHVLITGFEPFGDDEVNPSAILVQALAAIPITGADIRHVILPCAFAPLDAALRNAIDAHLPNLVIGFGLATGRAGISIERVAINVIDARIPDNLGAAPIDEPVVATAPAAYFSTLPIKAIRAGLLDAGIPAEISQTAGTYVCNAAFFLTRHIAATSYPDLRSGFVHIPCLPDMPATGRGAPSLDLETLKLAADSVIKTCLECHTDHRIAGGAVS